MTKMAKHPTWPPKTDVPVADNFEGIFCDHCHNLHVLGLGENGEELCLLTFNEEQLAWMLERVRERKKEFPIEPDAHAH